MTPHEFITKWQNSKLKERAAAQEHFIDLCRVLGEKTPAEVDASGLNYAFEVGATKTTGGRGFADVFKREHFGWEYKGTHANLETAFSQLQRYAVALDNPPLLIVSDIGTTIHIHTNWTNSVSHTYVIPIAELGDAEKRGWLKSAFNDPEALRPKKTRQQLTEEVAGEFANLARSLRSRGNPAEEVAHFINKLVFCMFAEDVKLLPETMFTRMLDRAIDDPTEFEDFARTLFSAMKTGGRVGFEKVAWFNGGLFNDDRVFALTRDEIKIVRDASARYWGDVDPSILGTLFERGLDPDKRSQLGAHYTDREKIMMIVQPVVVEPLVAEWERAKSDIAALTEKAQRLDNESKTKGGRAASAALGQATVARKDAQAVLDRHLKRLADFRVLDPACGSGNFLYIALRELKDLEHRAQVEAEAMGLPRRFPSIGPEVVKGIEINPYAAELARVSVWIGEIQWMLKNGFPAAQNPVLKPMETIECRDALLTLTPPQDGGDPVWTEAEWPAADVIIGNPPFLGAKIMKRSLGVENTERVRATFGDRLPGFTDLVCYWFEKARAAVTAGSTTFVGLVATKSIAKNTNLPVMRRITNELTIYNAYANEPWVVDGAAVRVALVCFGRSNNTPRPAKLNGREVPAINASLTSGTDYSTASRLAENRGRSLLGIQKSGPFDIDGTTARQWLRLPLNPNGRSNAEVLKPYMNGDEIVSGSTDRWLIDFPLLLRSEDAALWQAPFEYLRSALYDPSDVTSKLLREERQQARDQHARERWWEPYWPRPEMRSKIAKIERYLVTPETAEHRVFAWLSYPVLPDKNLIVFPGADDTTFGILQSRFHDLWVTAIGNRMGAGNQRRYNNLTCFETFPFPDGLSPDIPRADYAADTRAITIAAAAARLNQLRENWLAPADLVRREPEVVPGFPDRVLPVSPEAEQILKRRTLTNLYNERPAWLDQAHRALDAAVADAYGWPADMSDDDALTNLFALNQRKAAERDGSLFAEAATSDA
ncbi:class I SAM-dependent DNA methyltransferase [Bradyrhizobium sp. 193]|uniref:class I SAM-dependent DNA methyltransferase n=1 Tax=Bradyrhizobium sp. 193 TaxID=2782661 RepID=UPI001FF7A160|nr:DNA methyltransferase [Bradyrhizobium sp. 193]MCK1483352.1 class I SAM-dependent DNA methyltransferase [Bradyrhizobium sp. 193]